MPNCLGDLERESFFAQEINDKLKDLSGILKLVSLYEARPTELLLTNSIILSEASATLGLPNKQTASLDRSHQWMTKCGSPVDACYLIIRNSLASLITYSGSHDSHDQQGISASTQDHLSMTTFETRELRDELIYSRGKLEDALSADSKGNLDGVLSSGLTELDLKGRSHMELNDDRRRVIDFFLVVNPLPTLTHYINIRVGGTGQWLTQHRLFQEWKAFSSYALWLSGGPGEFKLSILKLEICLLNLWPARRWENYSLQPYNKRDS